MPTRTFIEISVGTLFHFVQGTERDSATWVKIASHQARAQVGGEVMDAPPGAVVTPIGL